MKLFSVGKTDVLFNPLLLLPVIYYVLNDGLYFVMMLFFVLSLHELCHSIMAYLLYYRINAVEIHPFGFEARLEGEFKSARDELVIAAAGPLFSILTGLCTLAFKSNAILAEFSRMNIAIGVLNLIPAYPLDGGRIIFSILYLKVDAVKAKKATVLLGFLLAFALLLLSLFVRPFNPSLIVFSLFIALADIQETKRLRSVKIYSLLKSRSALKKGEAIPVKFIALHKSVTYSEALRHIGTNTYTVIIVLDDDMNELERITQNSLLDKATLLSGRLDFETLG